MAWSEEAARRGAEARPSLKVVRVIARLNVGGPARQAVILQRDLPSRGFSTRLVHGTIGPGEASLEDLLDPGDKTVVKIPELGRRIHLLDDARALGRLVRLVFAERPDVLHTHTAKAGALGRVAALAYNLTRSRRKRCLVVHTFHGHVFEGYFGAVGSSAVRASERVLARVTDRIIAISPLQRTAITERFHIAPAERVSVVKLGLDLDPFFEIGPVDPALRTELGFPRESVLFGCIGRLVAIKNVPMLLEAFALATASAAGIRLVVVGDGEEKPGLLDRARVLGIEHLVRFVGWRRDLVSIHAGLDAVVLTSANEGTPVALIEGLAAGRPVVATSVGGVPDVVTHGRNGLLAPPGDTRAFADALVRLAGNAEERQRLGHEGRLGAARYGRLHLVDAVSALYHEGLRARRGDSELAARGGGATLR